MKKIFRIALDSDWPPEKVGAEVCSQLEKQGIQISVKIITRSGHAFMQIHGQSQPTTDRQHKK